MTKPVSRGSLNLNRSRSAHSFRLWAPRCRAAALEVCSRRAPRLFPLKKDPAGYFSLQSKNIRSGERFYYVLDGQKKRPDPLSRFQPEGVHKASCVTDFSKFRWKDRRWKGLKLQDLIFYELHVGTFTPEGTFSAAARKIPYLKKLGITCVEIMPVAQFPGTRNWGYDGVGLYAVQNSYGGPESFRRFVDACHQAGLGVCLDVVYNHLGPEGNYLHDFGYYFTSRHHTPWGDAINYDDKQSGPVRRFVIENALFWIEEFHIDVLRLDAVHSIIDESPRHILAEMNDAVQARARRLGRQVHLIAESDLNDSRMIRSKKQKGYGLSGQWSDDFHHAVHAYLTGERRGYYRDFGKIRDIAKAVTEGFVYDGQYSPFRGKKHGNPVRDLPPEKLVICTQNHDQVGNRAFGERLGTLISFEAQKTAAMLLLLSPQTPLLFMGQEYGEKAPFQYFTDHGDPELIKAVAEGRKKEFAAFGFKEIPAPHALKTFKDSRLQWSLLKKTPHRHLWQWYHDLIAFRKKYWDRARVESVWFHEGGKWLAFELHAGGKKWGLFYCFNPKGAGIPLGPFSLKGRLHSEHRRYGGRKTSPFFAQRGRVIFEREGSCAGLLLL